MSAGLKPGIRIRVKEGTPAPDLSDHSIGGWTGTITQVAGKKEKQKIFIEWDAATLEAMSPEYLQACEEKQLYHLMACLGPDQLEPADE